MRKRAPTRADLARKVAELEAQLASTLHFADIGLTKAGTDKMMASAVIVRLHTLGGSEITPTFAIRDGLSPETIAALRKDIARSWELATMHVPSGAREIKS